MKFTYVLILFCVAVQTPGCAVAHNDMPEWRPVTLKHIHLSSQELTLVRAKLHPIIHHLTTEARRGDNNAWYDFNYYQAFKEVDGNNNQWVFAEIEEHGVPGVGLTNSLVVLRKHQGKYEIVRELDDGDGLAIDDMVPQAIWNAATHQEVVAYYMDWTPHGGAGWTTLFITKISSNSNHFDTLVKVNFPEHDFCFTKVRIQAGWKDRAESYTLHVPSNMVDHPYWKTDLYLPSIVIKTPQITYHRLSGMSFKLTLLLDKNNIQMSKYKQKKILVAPGNTKLGT